MEPFDQTAVLDSIVGRFFAINTITHGGNPKDPYLARYTGCLRDQDSAKAYDSLSGMLDPMGVTPLFRKEKGEQVIFLIPSLPKPKPSNPVVNLVMFILTIGSVLFTGATFAASQSLSLDSSPLGILRYLLAGWPFAVSLLLILGSHEFGHYLVGRFHKAAVSLPYFIPFPFSQFGTMGAFINMKAPPKNRRILLDIGIAGPLAGLLVAIPVLLIGLSLSSVDRLSIPSNSNMLLQMEGNSILYLLAKFAVFHRWLPEPATFGNLPPLLYWVRYFFTGQPFPAGGFDVSIGQVAMAGWAGLLVTALNLIPAGQLDGGHMLYVLLGAKRARLTLPIVLFALVLMGIAWNGWWLWAALIFFLVGRSYAEPLDQITPLNPARKLLAVLALIIFILVFTPVPLQIISG